MHFGLHSRCLFRADNMNIVCLSGALALALALARRHTMTGIFDLPRSHWKWSANIWNLSNGKQCTIEVDNFFHSAVYDVLEWLFNIWWSNAVLRMVMRMTATSVHRDKQTQKLNAWIIFFTKILEEEEMEWTAKNKTTKPIIMCRDGQHTHIPPRRAPLYTDGDGVLQKSQTAKFSHRRTQTRWMPFQVQQRQQNRN